MPRLLRLIQETGTAITQYKKKSETLHIKQKKNNTPVTAVDYASHTLMNAGLKIITPNIPIISEESSDYPAYAIRKNWDFYWLLDPLDGTRAFIKGLPDYSINLSLLFRHTVVLGIVYVPESKVFYYGLSGKSYKLSLNNNHIKPLKVEKPSSMLRIAVSRSTNLENLSKIFASLKDYSFVKKDSALKICLIADGEADLYLRLGPTSEWDTAAGHYILQCAGGDLLDLHYQTLRYNQMASFENPSFLAIGDLSYAWNPIFQALDALKIF